MARTHDDDDDGRGRGGGGGGGGFGVAQDGGHTPNKRLTDMQPWFAVYFFIM